MTITSPEWLLLIPVALLLWLVIPKLGLLRPLRFICICLISLLLAKPEYDSLDQHIDLWVLLDQSDSTENLVEEGLPEWKVILENSKPSEEDRIFYVDYASDVSVQEPNTELATYTGNKSLTRTQLALEDVLARRSEDRPSRVVIFTDGYSTEPLHEVANKLSVVGVPVDFRIVRENNFADYRVSKVSLPTQIQVGEPFLLGVSVDGHKDVSVPLRIYKNGEKIQDTEVEIINGKGEIEFASRIQEPGSYAYTAKIFPEDDAHEGNNHIEKWIQVTGGPRVLLVSNYDNDPLVDVLRNQSYEVDFVSDSETLTVGQLSAAKSVIFNNVPAHEVPEGFLKALDFYVNEQGGGFLMVGGKRSFASGGYYNSPVDSLLPVTMELKNDHRKLSVAISIVMDRSGSMAATVANPGGGTVTKMSLANNGAAEAINLLGSRDQIAVYAVDTQSTTVLALQSISSNKPGLMQKTRKIISSGGGIYVYTGLQKAWDDLKSSPIDTKHMILFSDAADSEEPGSYKKLLKEMELAGATVSKDG